MQTRIHVPDACGGLLPHGVIFSYGHSEKCSINGWCVSSSQVLMFSCKAILKVLFAFFSLLTDLTFVSNSSRYLILLKIYSYSTQSWDFALFCFVSMPSTSKKCAVGMETKNWSMVGGQSKFIARKYCFHSAQGNSVNRLQTPKSPHSLVSIRQSSPWP